MCESEERVVEEADGAGGAEEVAVLEGGGLPGVVVEVGADADAAVVGEFGFDLGEEAFARGPGEVVGVSRVGGRDVELGGEGEDAVGVEVDVVAEGHGGKDEG